MLKAVDVTRENSIAQLTDEVLRLKTVLTDREQQHRQLLAHSSPTVHTHTHTLSHTQTRTLHSLPSLQLRLTYFHFIDIVHCSLLHPYLCCPDVHCTI